MFAKFTWMFFMAVEKHHGRCRCLLHPRMTSGLRWMMQFNALKQCESIKGWNFPLMMLKYPAVIAIFTMLLQSNTLLAILCNHHIVCFLKFNVVRCLNNLDNVEPTVDLWSDFELSVCSLLRCPYRQNVTVLRSFLMPCQYTVSQSLWMYVERLFLIRINYNKNDYLVLE